MLFERRIDAQTEIAGRTDFECDALLDQMPGQLFVFDRSHAMPEPFGAESAKRAPDALCASRLARVRCAVQSRDKRALEPWREWLGRVTVLGARQAKCDDPVRATVDRDVRNEVSQRNIGVDLDRASRNVEDPAQLDPELLAYSLAAPWLSQLQLQDAPDQAWTSPRRTARAEQRARRRAHT